MSAWASRQRLVLGQETVNGKSNEITATSRLPERLELAGALVTIDAIPGSSPRACQRAIAEAICGRGADYGLPPKSPKLNGAVERNQGARRYEFYACFDLPYRIDKLQTFVAAFAHRFNIHRPHQALGDRTPAEYVRTISSGPAASQAC